MDDKTREIDATRIIIGELVKFKVIPKTCPIEEYENTWAAIASALCKIEHMLTAPKTYE